MTRSFRTPLIAAVLLAAPAMGLVGCGDSGAPAASTAAPAATATTPATSNTSLSAADLLASATKAVTAASSVHIDGTAAAASAGEAASLMLTATRNNEGEGTVKIAGRSLDVLVAGGTPYIKAAAGFWQSSGASAPIAAKLGGKWITAPASGSSAGQLTGISNFVDMAKVVDPILARFGTPTKAGTSTVDGVTVITITDPAGNTLYVPASGDPLPVRYVSTAKGKSGDVHYSKWSDPVTVSAPANAIDLGKITGSG